MKLLARMLSSLALCFFSSQATSQTIPNRYILILDDTAQYKAKIQQNRATLRADLEKQGIQVTGSVNTLFNAVFVNAAASRVQEMKSMPGVKAVVPVRRYHKQLNRATQLLNAPVAWSMVGGIGNAGAGMKIAILDSGIDQTHPAFQDSSLSMPAGFPVCSGTDCSFTSNKVVVARSYVRQLAAGSGSNPAANSRPDDYSPRDRDGHGTAVASCAAGQVNTGLVTFSGFAPKAYLGNYKIYGSPGVNDFTSSDVILQALEDAYRDGMDVIAFSHGAPALSGPLDTGAACNQSAGVSCDVVAQAFETLAQKGLIIVTATGNDGNSGTGSAAPTYNSIESPADAPSVIAVGAATNSHAFTEVVKADDPASAATLQNIVADPGDATVPGGSLTAALIDITQLGTNAFGCSPLPPATLIGAIALIEQGQCTLAAKLENAENAGAEGVVFYSPAVGPIVSPIGLSAYAIPAVIIPNASGLAFKRYVDANPGRRVTIAADGMEVSAQPDQVAFFSSRGPTTGDAALKPDLLAIGTNVYMAGQSYDMSGELFSDDRYVVSNGASFAAGMAAGVAALVKQHHPAFTALQVKSALANSASTSVQTDDSSNSVDVRSNGAGLLDAGSALNALITAVPSSISFGALQQSSLPKTLPIQFTNSGTEAVTLSLTLSPGRASTNASLQFDNTSLTLNPGSSGTVNLTLKGSLPPAGAYFGAITVQGQGVALHIPYLYSVASGTAANLIPLTGASFDGTAGGGIADGVVSVKLVDSVGLPIAGAPVVFRAQGGTLQNADSTTNQYGIAKATPVLGSQPGNVTFTATSRGLNASFSGYSRAQPLIAAGGIVDAAALQTATPVAPGSYITIFGTGLSDYADYAESSFLPLAIDQAFVSFDVPAAGISVPGHLTYVSPTQINVQVPWELQGQTSAQVKVTVGHSPGTLVTLQLADYAPALFQSASIAAALNQNNGAVTNVSPAQSGQVVQLFANGLGPVKNQPASGEPSSSSTLASTAKPVTVTIGGQRATVLFSGLAPGFSGLYQVNALVPLNSGPGLRPVVISIGGVSSAPVDLPVQ